MVRGLFTLKVLLDADRLSTEMAGDKFIIRAERALGEHPQYLCKVFDLKELLLSSNSPIEDIFKPLVDGLEWVEEPLQAAACGDSCF